MMLQSFTCTQLRPRATELRRKVPALSCSLNAKQCLHITGGNGSGKTTLLLCMLGLKPSSGSCTIKGTSDDLSALNYAHYIDYLPANNQMPDYLTVNEYLEHLIFLHKTASPLKTKQANQFMPIDKLRARKCTHLSQGEKQRCLINRLIQSNKPIWLLDEPFNHLDTESQQQLMHALKNHTHHGGIILLTHHGQLPAYDRKNFALTTYNLETDS
jgi:heme exporter protein A